MERLSLTFVTSRLLCVGHHQRRAWLDSEPLLILVETLPGMVILLAHATQNASGDQKNHGAEEMDGAVASEEICV